MSLAKINEIGTARVLDSKPGMIFPIDCFTEGTKGKIAHVRDYRFPTPALGREFQIWSISADGYEVVPD